MSFSVSLTMHTPVLFCQGHVCHLPLSVTALETTGMHTFVVSKAIGHARRPCANCPAELEDQVQKNPALWGNVNVMMKAANVNTLESLKTILAGGLGSKSAAVGDPHAALVGHPTPGYPLPYIQASGNVHAFPSPSRLERQPL